MRAMHVVRLSLLIGVCLSALGAAPIELRLWPGKAPGSENWSVPESITERGGSRIATNVTDPTLTVYLPDTSKSIGAAIVVAPGGALQALSIDGEGTRVAEWLNSKGIAGICPEVPPAPTATRHRPDRCCTSNRPTRGVENRQGEREPCARRRGAR